MTAVRAATYEKVWVQLGPKITYTPLFSSFNNIYYRSDRLLTLCELLLLLLLQLYTESIFRNFRSFFINFWSVLDSFEETAELSLSK